MALACVCFFWGTTYLAIRIGVQTISPATLMCARYLASGLILVIGARLKGAAFPDPREFALTALYGLAIIGIGTGSLAISEQWVPSGLTALFITTQPFWLVGVGRIAARLHGQPHEPLHARTIAGLVIGLAGVVYLVAPGVEHEALFARRDIRTGFLLLQFGVIMWSIGSIAQRRLVTRAHPFVNGGIQQLATGLAYFVIAAFDGRKAHWTQSTIAAVAYLAVFGGVVGYSSYIFALDRLPLAVVSIYTYINPVVAVILGWLFYREELGWREINAMLVIFLGVALVKGIPRRQKPDPSLAGGPA